MKGNIAIFVPFLGCPHRCSFCDQTAITGEKNIPDGRSVEQTVRSAVEYLGEKAKQNEIAFFGGSFTAVPREYMIELLEAAYKFVKSGEVYGIRLSTRPDAIDRDVLEVLKNYGVTAIELGAQSMDDEVLSANLRGHLSEDVLRASQLIKQSGFMLGLQMMTGLYKSSREKDILTAEKLCALHPDTMRIYPAITLKNTLLERKFRDGEYTPPDLDETVELCARLLRYFEENNVEVIKLGLHASADVEKNYVAGPYHQALRELCEAKIYLSNALEALKKPGQYIIYVGRCNTSKMIGQHRSNLAELEKQGFICRVRERDDLGRYEIIAEGQRAEQE